MTSAPLGNSQKAARFTRIRLLGEGASGRVFEVFDSVHQARCALKELRKDRALDPARIGRFKDEFRALTTISHPNLVQVYELLVDGSDVRLLMELVEGVDFVSHVRPGDRSAAPTVATESGQGDGTATRGGKLSAVRLRPALAQLASGVLALHAAGKVHCDLKPENVLVTEAGRVVIVDFGLLSTRERSNRARQRGTPPYVAPEQEDGVFSEAGDWYAFGVILYLALTGRLPFQGSGQALAYEKRFGRPIDPRRIAQDVPDDLSELALKLLSPDPSRRAVVEDIARASAVDTSAKSSFAAATNTETFVGRSAELAQLRRAFERVTAGETRVVFVHGESGVGKTRLVGHLLRGLERDASAPLVLRSVCYADASVPYRGLDAVMDRIAADLPQRAPSLDPARIAPLATMFPVFGEVTAEYAALRETQPATARQRAVDGLRALFAGLAQSGPVVLHIDDFQRADAETVEVLAELVRPPSIKGFLVILSYRTVAGQAGETIAAARSALACDDDVTVDALSEHDVRTLARALVPRGSSDVALAAIVAGARGNPFFVRQLALAHAEGPRGDSVSLESVLGMRLLSLSTGQRDYLELSAVAGPLDERVLVRALGVSGAEVLAARRHLLAECFVRHADAHDGAVEPYHDQVREAVLGAMSSVTRRRHHERLAEALEASGTAEPEALALHFRGAGDVAKARRYTEVAADTAAQLLAFDHAAKLYSVAIALATGADLQRIEGKLARTLSAAGRSEEAAATFLTLASRTPDDLELRLHAGDELLRAGHVDRGLTILREIARAIGEPFPDSELVATVAVLVHGWRLRSVAVPATLAERTTPTQRHQLALCHTIAKQLSMVDPLRSVLFQRRYLRLALRVESGVDIAKGLAIEASVSAHMSPRLGGGAERAAELVAKCEELADRTGDPEVRAALYFATGQVAYARGRWSESRRLLERALAVTRIDVVLGVRWDVALCQSFIAFMLWMEGDVAELRRRLGEYMVEARTVRSLETITALRVGTMLALCDDDVPGARRTAAEQMSKWPASPWRLQHYFDAVARVEIELYEGNAQAAWEQTRTLWKKTAAAGLFTQEFFVASCLAQRARVAASVGRWRDAERDVRALETRPESWARSLGAFVHAGLDAALGSNESALKRLEGALIDLRACDLGLYLLAAKWRFGSLQRDPALVAEASEELAARGVRKPARLAVALVPWPASKDV